MKAVSPPYATVPELIATPWTVSIDGREVSLEDGIRDWDPGVDLHCSRSISVDVATLRKVSGLGSGSSVRLLAGWHCDATRTREFTSELDLELEGEEEAEVHVSCDVAGRDVAISLSLECHLVLVRRSPDSEQTAAYDLGASLWADVQTVNLEGVAGRFPMEWIDFRGAAYPSQAAWCLDWDPDRPEHSVLGGMRLYLNSSHAGLAQQLDSEHVESSVLWQSIRIEVARQLISGGLLSDEFVERADQYDDGTVGATIRRLANVVFRGDSIEAARDLLFRDPGRFGAYVQDRLRYLSEESK